MLWTFLQEAEVYHRSMAAVNELDANTNPFNESMNDTVLAYNDVHVRRRRCISAPWRR